MTESKPSLDGGSDTIDPLPLDGRLPSEAEPDLEDGIAVLHAIESSQVDFIFWMRDLESQRVVYASRNYESVWGRPRPVFADGGSRDWIEAIPLADRQGVLEALDRLRDGDPCDVQYPIDWPDGSRRWIRDRAQPIEDATGQITRAVGIAQDVSEARWVREQLRLAVLAADRAEDTERKLLAGDLHDSIGQLLPLARIKLDALLDGGLDDGRAAVDAALRNLRSLLSQAEEQVRTLTFRLSPIQPNDVGIVAAIEQLATIVQARYGLVVCVHDDGLEKSLESDRAAVLVRGVRELLINVSRHAGTDKADVRLMRDEDFVLASVEDGGVGFDSAEQRYGGFGLMSLRDRLEGIGGTLEIESRSGDGTRARLRVPAAES